MKPIIIPNCVTFLRILLVLPIIAFLFSHSYKIAFYLFIIAGISDGIDGFLARRFRWFTRFGSILDPYADKLLMVSTFLTLAYLEKIPVWLLVIVILRDVIIITGAIAYHYLIGPFELVPSILSKLNTLLQLTLIVLILFEAAYYLVPLGWIEALSYSVFITNILSLAHYIVVWSNRAIRSIHAK